MEIFVDADACPVITQIEKVAVSHGISCTLLCDTNHLLFSDTSEIKVIGAGPDAVDFALINLCRRGDIVVTQDYGVAALALGKGAYAIHQSGRVFTDDNIEGLLHDRYLNKKASRSSGKHHIKGNSPRTREDDITFEKSFEKLVEEAVGSN